MDKSFLVEQLRQHLQTSARVAVKATEGAVVGVKTAAGTDNRLRSANLARAQAVRAERSYHETAVLDSFRPKPLPPGSRIALGAIVEVEDGSQGRTFFLAPVGAGTELTGPGGDGFLSVVTPQSPIGRAVMGKREGDEIEVDLQGDAHEWVISFVG
ncbi:MAG: GreA/GreB family elongation factor [Myxococcales bacterium]|nr:GreA/GreB family elongation factor [Myxococcales bacterium]